MPDVLIQPHSASLQMMFYAGEQFPVEYRGNIFAAQHGSWNRAKPTGYKIIRLIVKDGVPTGEYEDFVTSFVLDDAHVWGAASRGRPDQRWIANLFRGRQWHDLARDQQGLICPRAFAVT
jgi:glucose/arabinose dehydrogenase